MLSVLYKIGEVLGFWYNSLVDFLAQEIFYYMESPLFNTKINQLVFNKYAEILMWIGSVITLTTLGINQTMYAVGFFMPAIWANAFPPVGKVIVKRYKIDWLRKLYSQPMNLLKLGSHKTWGGFLFGVGIGTFVAWPVVDSILILLNYFFNADFVVYVNFALAFPMSVAALTGDAVGSWIKRKKRIAPGEFVPMDLYDWSLATLIVCMFFCEFWQNPILLTMTALTVLPIGSSIGGLLGVILKIKEGR